MTRVIVNDASCLIDLRKGRLLHAMLSLPFQFVIPFPVRASELLDFTPQEWQTLDDSGVETYDLEPDAVADALRIKTEHPALSANDCFCLVATLRREEAVLLTGDGQLRRAAELRQVEVHGVLWIIDLLDAGNLAPKALLRAALEIWRDDPSVFVPDAEIELRLQRIG
ncbi:type II toxin-antitoxin system VapC family toxin [Hyphomicrobium zavarzinii]|uniref:type II toxin-antitoxin system VapC family toxin n=1 Tax=Hyphomicrobium zavarzinii TaxID=48292 RepID=UPI00037A878B|nr:type II toxin-antitoxin system VapC family toxin [Hyphomicrobium zavarzinii]